ncbi:MAG: CHAP domain-containing protein [Parasphingorhabdus sp.]|uniref:CHAP domain-containing protein n=1 Tax=Parasphingorhabdus sp. TaxID=2709688 RepID=UPI0030010E22
MRTENDRIKLFRTLGSSIVPILLVLQAIFFPAIARAEDNSPSEYLQCVPYARELSGIQIYGDAHTWWRQARFAYERGNIPQVGAVMSLKSHGNMELGHVAVVSRILGDRHILLSHANWSPINGRRGQIERNVAAVDVSDNGDWSQVKIWYAPIGALGSTTYPINGFIYPSGKPSDFRNVAGKQWASATTVRDTRAPNRNLFAQNMKSELKQAARQEQMAEALTGKSQPTDLIGELLDRVGS